MADVSSGLCYALADTLSMELHWDHRAEKLKGESDRILTFGDLEVMLPVRVVDSKVLEGRAILLVRVLGNLLVLVTASMRRVRVYVLNAAKYDGDANTMLANTICADHKTICAGLGKAIVRVFESEGHSKTRWNKIKVATPA
ncbi:hypothetical protein [Hyphomicrobium sp. ghe19]|uniref:hypothetical protein n=1 Tax=Hyphomicrobium sp. ghe19 TaxID=2682968 RepID=UPI00136747A1|nr:hypothetical protein HYPP_02514 [Hyphomicrobium sp. ghe19]